MGPCPMQLVVPIAVSIAVRIDTITCITVFHVSFFIALNFQIIILNCQLYISLFTCPANSSRCPKIRRHPHPRRQLLRRHRRLHPRWQEQTCWSGRRFAHLAPPPQTENRRSQGQRRARMDNHQVIRYGTGGRTCHLFAYDYREDRENINIEIRRV